MDEVLDEKLTISNVPNPFNNFTKFQLSVFSSTVEISVYDLSGRIVDSQSIKTTNSGLEFQYNSPDLKNGLYHYGVITEQGNRFTGKFIIN